MVKARIQRHEHRELMTQLARTVESNLGKNLLIGDRFLISGIIGGDGNRWRRPFQTETLRFPLAGSLLQKIIPADREILYTKIQKLSVCLFVCLFVRGVQFDTQKSRDYINCSTGTRSEASEGLLNGPINWLPRNR